MYSCWSLEKADRPTFSEIVAHYEDYQSHAYQNIAVKTPSERNYENINPKNAFITRARKGSYSDSTGYSQRSHDDSAGFTKTSFAEFSLETTTSEEKAPALPVKTSSVDTTVVGHKRQPSVSYTAKPLADQADNRTLDLGLESTVVSLPYMTEVINVDDLIERKELQRLPFNPSSTDKLSQSSIDVKLPVRSAKVARSKSIDEVTKERPMQVISRQGSVRVKRIHPHSEPTVQNAKMINGNDGDSNKINTPHPVIIAMTWRMITVTMTNQMKPWWCDEASLCQA